MAGIITLCSLLPSVPAAISPHLGDVLEVFVRTSGILVNKSGKYSENYNNKIRKFDILMLVEVIVVNNMIFIDYNVLNNLSLLKQVL